MGALFTRDRYVAVAVVSHRVYRPLMLQTHFLARGPPSRGNGKQYTVISVYYFMGTCLPLQYALEIAVPSWREVNTPHTQS